MEKKQMKFRESFVFYSRYFETLFNIPKDECLEVLHAISEYIHGRNYPLTGIAAVAFIPIRQSLDMDNEKYQMVCQQRSMAGKRSGESRQRQNAKQTKRTSVDFVEHKPTKATEYEYEDEDEYEDEYECENDCEYDCENESENEPENENDLGNHFQREHGNGNKPATVSQEAAETDITLTVQDAPPAPGKGKISAQYYGSVMQRFNTLFANRLPQVKQMSQARRKAVKARVAENGIESIAVVMQNVSRSDFLMGANNHGWHADFDWIFRPANYLKILEGNYNNHQSNAANQQDNKQCANEYALRQFNEARRNRGVQDRP